MPDAPLVLLAQDPESARTYLASKVAEDFSLTQLPWCIIVGGVVLVGLFKAVIHSYKGRHLACAKWYGIAFLGPILAFVFYHKFGPAQALYWLYETSLGTVIAAAAIMAACVVSRVTASLRGAAILLACTLVWYLSYSHINGLERSFTSVFRPTEAMRIAWAAGIAWALYRIIRAGWPAPPLVRITGGMIAGCGLMLIMVAASAYKDLVAHSAVGSTALNAAVTDARRKVRSLLQIRDQVAANMAENKKMLASGGASLASVDDLRKMIDTDASSVAKLTEVIAQAERLVFTIEQLAKRSRTYSPEQIQLMSETLREHIPEQIGEIAEAKPVSADVMGKLNSLMAASPIKG